ncbi:MAG: hypothetical protein CTY33_00215 [Methylotenera sp.]|nr:MAG: hypothetical protein CTY33_00215 [Methylotenera sp.]
MLLKFISAVMPTINPSSFVICRVAFRV